jgi:putative hydrolase of HD superfamily
MQRSTRLQVVPDTPAPFGYQPIVPKDKIDRETLSYLHRSMALIPRAHVLDGHGRRENNAEHCYTLGVEVSRLIRQERPDLDPVRSRDLVDVHDYVEKLAGDTPIRDREGLKTKEAREAEAYRVMIPQVREDSPYIAELLEECRDCATAEARFVSAMDKVEAMRCGERYDGLTWREYDDRFEDLVESQLPKAAIDPTAFREMVKVLRETGRDWEKYGMPPISGDPNAVIDRVIHDLQRGRPQGA